MGSIFLAWCLSRLQVFNLQFLSCLAFKINYLFGYRFCLMFPFEPSLLA